MLLLPCVSINNSSATCTCRRPRFTLETRHKPFNLFRRPKNKRNMSGLERAEQVKIKGRETCDGRGIHQKLIRSKCMYLSAAIEWDIFRSPTGEKLDDDNHVMSIRRRRYRTTRYARLPSKQWLVTTPSTWMYRFSYGAIAAGESRPSGGYLKSTLQLQNSLRSSSTTCTTTCYQCSQFSLRWH